MDFLKNHVEALIFCSTQPIKKGEIQACLAEMFDADVPMEDIEQALDTIQQKYSSDEYSFDIQPEKMKENVRESQMVQWRLNYLVPGKMQD